MGVGSVINMVGYLGEMGIPVALAVTLDGSTTTVPAGKVGHFVNLYIASGVITKGPKFSGALSNIDL